MRRASYQTIGDLSKDRPHNGLDILAATGAAYATPYPPDNNNNHPLRPAHPPAAHSQQRPIAPTSTDSPLPQPRHKRTAHGATKRASDDEDVSADGEDPSKKQKDRTRITRACDRCNQLRTRCSNQHPCTACIENNVECTSSRVAKKRGKTSAKDKRRMERERELEAQRAIAGHGLPADSGPAHAPAVNATAPPHDPCIPPSAASSRELPAKSSVPLASPSLAHPSPEGFGFGEFRNVPGYFANGSEAGYDHFPEVDHTGSLTAGPRMPTPRQHRPNGSHTESRFPPPSPGGASMSGWLTGLNAAQSPGRFSPSRFSIPSMPSPSNTFFNLPNNDQIRPNTDLKYPVLKPLIPYLQGIIPPNLACELLEMYFESSTSAFQHPTSSYVIAYVFRKKSFLTSHNPRLCSPALLASMMYIAAQESDAAFLKSSVTSKAAICAKLTELTISLLQPLVHRAYRTPDDAMAGAMVNSALGGFGSEVNLMVPGGRQGSESGQHDVQTASGEVDDVVTYMHLATVVSASEAKAASMRWWAPVYSLVKEYRFNRELPRAQDDTHSDGSMNSPSGMARVSEETREERRRVWWLVYTVDKHLALCYNQPLNIRDCECYDLLRPVSEIHWQSGDKYVGPLTPDEMRPRGIGYTMVDHNIFGFFTPLMTLLGEAIDLQQIRYRARSQHPMPQVAEESCAMIRSRVDIFLNSVHEFRNANLPQGADEGFLPSSDPPPDADPTVPKRRTIPEHHVQTIVATSYASYVARVIKVLVSGKWDPLSLLDETYWISSEDFVTATTTAVEGAEFLSAILTFDSALSFMPWFFGIYLLHGSFLLLLFADRLGADVGDRYTNALELSARATESCVVTLNTEYQRNFRKVMRSALSQVRGRIPVHVEETYAKRREVLGMYRWTPDGRGLAL